MASDDCILVFTNAPDPLLAKRIAHVVLEDGLAACVNLGLPTLSMYRWKGVIEGDEETPLIIKSTADRRDALVAALRKLHPYEVPEIVVVPVTGGLPEYLSWVYQETRGPLHDEPAGDH